MVYVNNVYGLPKWYLKNLWMQITLKGATPAVDGANEAPVAHVWLQTSC